MAEPRRLGENVYVKPRTCLSINILVLRVLGVWFPEEKRASWKTTLYFFYALFTQAIFYFIYVISEMIQMILVFGDIEKMCEASFLLLTHVAEFWKNYTFYKNFQKIAYFLDELEKEIFLPRNRKQEQIHKWAMTRARSDSVILLSMGMVTCVLWALFPFIEKSGDDIRLPLAGWFPIDITVSPNFEIIFCYQIIAVTWNAMTIISMDTTSTGIFIHICCQIDMLKDSLENMKDNAVASLIRKKTDMKNYFEPTDIIFTDEELENEMQITYRKCVIHHEEIIRYSEDVEEVFNTCFFAQFLGSQVIICLTLFKLTMVHSIFSIEFVSIVLYQACIVFELLLYCWHGNEMILKSDSISNSIYNSKWYEFSPKFSRNIILLMVRSKRPIHATSGKFFFLSLSTFTGILRLSWSYFAMLNSVTKKDD